MNIALYNFPVADLDRWRECFPKGLRVGIREPYLKRRADAAFGIRVDDPADLIVRTPVCGWRAGCADAVALQWSHWLGFHVGPPA